MTNQPTEIAIVGGGMVGGALALGLAQHGFAVTVIEHAEPAPFVADSQPDVRISAISAASVSLLKGLGVWDAVQAMRCHPYRRLETWEWETAHVVFDAAELKLPLLGYMVENTVLQQALWQALEAHPKVTLRVPGSLIALHRHNDLQELELKGGETIRAKLVIGADGANSQVRQMAGIGVHAWQYAQSCMLISVQCENDPGDSTWQQFTPDGPRAFLPLFDNWASLVWYDSPARIRQLQNMNMAQLQAEIAKHFPSRLGYVTPLAAGAFPLTRRHAPHLVTLEDRITGPRFAMAASVDQNVNQGIDITITKIHPLPRQRMDGMRGIAHQRKPRLHILQRMATYQRKRASGKRYYIPKTRREMLHDFRL